MYRKVIVRQERSGFYLRRLSGYLVEVLVNVKNTNTFLFEKVHKKREQVKIDNGYAIDN